MKCKGFVCDGLPLPWCGAIPHLRAVLERLGRERYGLQRQSHAKPLLWTSQPHLLPSFDVLPFRTAEPNTCIPFAHLFSSWPQLLKLTAFALHSYLMYWKDHNAISCLRDSLSHRQDATTKRACIPHVWTSISQVFMYVYITRAGVLFS